MPPLSVLVVLRNGSSKTLEKIKKMTTHLGFVTMPKKRMHASGSANKKMEWVSAIGKTLRNRNAITDAQKILRNADLPRLKRVCELGRAVCVSLDRAEFLDVPLKRVSHPPSATWVAAHLSIEE